MEQQPDGGVVVTFSSPDLDWAASTALAYGPLVSVLEPSELRTRMVEWTRAILDIYSDGKKVRGTLEVPGI
jgi:predicted DNA-binding transcriptional regulator YafY